MVSRFCISTLFSFFSFRVFCVFSFPVSLLYTVCLVCTAKSVCSCWCSARLSGLWDYCRLHPHGKVLSFCHGHAPTLLDLIDRSHSTVVRGLSSTLDNRRLRGHTRLCLIAPRFSIQKVYAHTHEYTCRQCVLSLLTLVSRGLLVLCVLYFTML